MNTTKLIATRTEVNVNFQTQTSNLGTVRAGTASALFPNLGVKPDLAGPLENILIPF